MVPDVARWSGRIARVGRIGWIGGSCSQTALLLVGAAAFSAGAYFITQWTGVENWNVGAMLGWPEYMP